MMGNNKLGYQFIAILTVIVWGTTYISTKVLLSYGLTPSEIFFCRFLLAYAAIWALSWKKVFADSIKDELLLIGAGLTGGSLYFLFENTALSFTFASDVSLLLCIAPIFTTFMNFIVYRGEKIRTSLIYGSLIAFIGVALVIYNGGVILKLNPFGDVLTMLAAFMWALYGVIIKKLNARYTSFFVSRKVFFYGLVTILPVFLMKPFDVPLSTFIEPEVWLNLLFLGIVASMLCYVSWTYVEKKIGLVRITNYIYFSPVVTLIASAILIHERITPVAIAGCAFIIGGVYWGSAPKIEKNKS